MSMTSPLHSRRRRVLFTFGVFTHRGFVNGRQRAVFAAKAVAGLALKAGVRKEINVVARLPVLGEVGQDFADDAAEFEAVSRAGRGV